MIKTLLIVSALVAVSLALTEKQYEAAFTQWMRDYKKSYHHDEFQVRYRTFKANLDKINTNNAKNNGMTLGLNEFTDLNSKEFAKYYLGLKRTIESSAEFRSATPSKVNSKLPTSYDWNTKGAVTPIKNQGQCGSCWSFSTTGSTEGCHQISTGNLVALSEQNLMDCSTAQGNEGCDGGLMTDAMNYIISNGGIDTEASYPYTAEDGTCHYSASNSGATLKSYVNVQSGSEDDLQAKAYVGPVSVAIDASQESFQMYQSGVYYEPACSSSALDHGVLVTGWGVDSNGTEYWIVKNSWGTSWGQDGFIWMSRNKNNNCGIATEATLPQC